MSAIANDTLITTARMAQFALLCVAVVGATKSRKHLPLVAWLAAALAYSMFSEYWLGPVLSHLPRPYRGGARVAMHAGQALYLAVIAGMTAVAWRAFRVRSVWLPLPFFLAFCALVILVDGYAHSPGPGLYRVGSIVFRSNTIFTATADVAAMLTWGVVVPRAARVLLEPYDEHDTALAVATLILIMPGTIHIGLPYVWSATTSTRIHAVLMLIASTLSVGVYAALLASGGKARWTELVENGLFKARRARAIDRIHARMVDTERRLTQPREGDPAAWRYIRELMERAGRADVDPWLMDVRARRVVDLEQAAAVTGTLRDADALRVLHHARALLAAADLPADAPVRVQELIHLRGVMAREPMIAPLTLMLISAMQGSEIGDADSVFAELEDLHRALVARGRGQRAAGGPDEIVRSSSPGG